jgi:hypothetical protein
MTLKRPRHTNPRATYVHDYPGGWHDHRLYVKAHTKTDHTGETSVIIGLNARRDGVSP